MLRLIEYFLIRWAEFARRSRWWTVGAFLIVSVLAGAYAATHLKVNTDTSQMLDPNLQFQKNSIALRDAFPQIKDDLIVIIRAPTLDEADAFAAALRDKLLADTDSFSAVFAPAEDPFFLNNGLLYLSASKLDKRLSQTTKAAGLIETLAKSPTTDTLFSTLADNDKLAEKSDLGQETLSSIYAELGDVIDASLKGERRPFSWMGAFDPDSRKANYTRIVYATPILDYSRLQPAKPGISAIKQHIADLEPQFAGRVETYITGDPALRADELASVTKGIGLSFLLSFLLVSALLVIAFRSIPMSLVTMASLLITLTLTSAFAALAVGELNLVSVAFTVLLVGLGLDFAIHLLLHIEERRAFGQTTRQALRGSMHETGVGLVLAAVTTALAFFSFIPTEFIGIAQLGTIAGAGVLIALFVSLTFVPATLGALPPPQSYRKGKSGKSRGVIHAVSGPVAIVVALLGVASLTLVPKSRFDADPMSLRDPNTQSVKGFNLLFDDEETVPYRLTVLVPSEKEALETAAKAKTLPTVSETRSLPDFVPKDQEEKLDLIGFAAGSLAFALNASADPNAPADTGGALKLETRLREAHKDGPGARLAQLLREARETARPQTATLIQNNIFAYWPQIVNRLKDQFNAQPITIDDLPQALRSRYLSVDGQWRVDIVPKEDPRNKAALDRFVKSITDNFTHVSGSALQSKRAGEVISESMLEATGIALLVITIFLALLVRNISLVFLMMLPLLLAASLTTATGVIFNIPFNYANVIVLPLLLGVGVDSGIHLVLRQQQVKAGEHVYGTSTPRAVFFSALTTVASFGSLMLSSHRGTASMGELLSIAIGYTLICTLIVLPPLFRLGERRAERAAAKTTRAAAESQASAG
ncbi:MAG: MMPL family transporter [Alphaproteobacteria bacterium]|nr:MMPL family transporter [Alphaproteobacteria bacterium]